MYKIEPLDHPSGLARYEFLVEYDRCEQKAPSMKSMIAQITLQLLMTHGRELVQGCRDLMVLSIQSSTYLE